MRVPRTRSHHTTERRASPAQPSATVLADVSWPASRRRETRTPVRHPFSCRSGGPPRLCVNFSARTPVAGARTIPHAALVADPPEPMAYPPEARLVHSSKWKDLRTLRGARPLGAGATRTRSPPARRGTEQIPAHFTRASLPTHRSSSHWNELAPGSLLPPINPCEPTGRRITLSGFRSDTPSVC